MSRNQKYLLYILLVWALIFLVHLDVIYVNIMEARNFITAREMVTNDNWILTTMNAEARYEKPPLPTWLTALSGLIFGFTNLFGMRLPAALVTLLLLYIFYRFIPKLGVSLKQAFLATLILASSFYIVFMGRNGQWDIFTHSFMMVAIFFLWNFFSSEKHLFKNAIFGAVFLGLSFMSKGPVSLYALFLPFLIAYGSTYSFRGFFKKWKAFIIFLILSVILSGWWFIYVRLADPVSFVEITTREATRWTNYNVRPFYYYWSFFTQSGIWTIPAFVALLYPYLKNRVVNRKAYKFSLFWTLAAVVLLSLIPEKKSRYLLPVLIPMAVNTSFYVEYLFRNFNKLPKKENWIINFNHGLIAGIGIIFPVAAYFLLELDGYWFWYISASIVLASIGIGILYYLKRRKYPQVFYLTVAFICGIIVFAFPLSNAFLKNPQFRNFDELQELAEAEDFQVYEYKAETPEIIWEYGEPIPKLYRNDSELPSEERFGVILREKDSALIDTLKRDFEVLSSERFDLNYVNPEASGYKDRLIRQFYLLQRKD
ncbi:ArnT family glycosyltransferase [Salinimicrobium sp. HB62]|uniref:ArnT family glycosyltransferase n=1 Tax=Salinimicrobium sp. HB62 TaxID=3077781 RepID=UPI002D7859E3|nr:glycosyltransferase family 39 protein [Salinimicrobium sp. HB62]